MREGEEREEKWREKRKGVRHFVEHIFVLLNGEGLVSKKSNEEEEEEKEKEGRKGKKKRTMSLPQTTLWMIGSVIFIDSLKILY